MWLAAIVIVAVVFMVVAGVLSGGIFTIVLVPLAVIVAITAIIYATWARANALSSGNPSESLPDSLPHSSHSNAPPRPSTPDELVDARRHQQ